MQCGVRWPCTNVMAPLALPVNEENEPLIPQPTSEAGYIGYSHNAAGQDVERW